MICRSRSTPAAALFVNHLVAWTGAEVVTLELAEFLAGNGWRVVICPATCSPELVNEVQALSPAVELAPGPLPACGELDLIWSMHHAAVPVLGRMTPQVGTRRPIFVFSHLSPYDPLEAASPVWEPIMADFVVANSEETANSLPSLLVPKIRIVPNPAPDRFFQDGRPSPHIRRLLWVSNHAPSEVREALSVLEARGIVIHRLGQDAEHRRVRPTDLAEADGVIAIGKTVQYALASQTPAYCYDRFGGPGWLTPSNFEAARQLNFSGRSHPHRRTGAEIAREIEEGYSAAQQAALGFPREEFRYRRWLEPILYEAQLGRSWTAAEVQLLQSNRDALAAEVRLVESLQRAVRLAEAGRQHGAQQAASFREAMRLLEETRAYSRTLEIGLAECQRIVQEREQELTRLRVTGT